MAHRAIISACFAEGKSTIRNISYSKDIKATINAMQLLGAAIEEDKDSLTVCGIGGSLITKDDTVVHCSESGSTLRFVIPIFLLTDKLITFTGDGNLLKRPQTVYKKICDEQGIKFEQTDSAITVKGVLNAGEYHVDGDISSQFITGMMYALSLKAETSVIKIKPPFESRSYVYLTIQAMGDFGVRAELADENTIVIYGGQRYVARDYTVEGDYSQFAFFGVLGAVSHDIVCHGVRHDSLQGDKAIVDILKSFGASLTEIDDGYEVKRSSLTGCDIDLQNCPDLGPVLMVLGLLSKGTTRIYNAQRLRLKESDRIACMQSELAKMGGIVEAEGGEIIIHGMTSQPYARDEIQTHIDHRIVMSVAVFASCSENPVVICDAENVNKSYPNFFDDLKKAGIEVSGF